ncbi:hypothetical protein MMC18_006187 [Xylographa bjoerkii]|nr:hypothetical protein [Xylographa bjoerkii]
MAPITSNDPQSLKRTSTDAGFDAPVPSKTRLTSVYHHSLSFRPDTTGQELGICQDNKAIQSLLSSSIVRVLEAVGFHEANPVAVESFRAEVEEYMVHFLASVRQSMLSSRRTQAIPQDFLHALNAHQLTLRSLLPHLSPPVPPWKPETTLASEPNREVEDHKHDQLIATLLSGPSERTSVAYIPLHFPILPSKHTYKFEEVFTVRETDPRRVRERATEEGRLGEEALRKLVNLREEHNSLEETRRQDRRRTVRDQRQALWRETMEAVRKFEGEDVVTEKPYGGHFEMDLDIPNSGSNSRVGFLVSAVNSDRLYWRKGRPKKPPDPNAIIDDEMRQGGKS